MKEFAIGTLVGLVCFVLTFIIVRFTGLILITSATALYIKNWMDRNVFEY